MFKIEIRLNEKKILQENQNSLEQLQTNIDGFFDGFNIQKRIEEDGSIIYYSSVTRDYSILGAIIMKLKRKTWFMNNVEKWIWHNNERQEDILYHYTKKKSVE